MIKSQADIQMVNVHNFSQLTKITILAIAHPNEMWTWR